MNPNAIMIDQIENGYVIVSGGKAVWYGSPDEVVDAIKDLLDVKEDK